MPRFAVLLLATLLALCAAMTEEPAAGRGKGNGQGQGRGSGRGKNKAFVSVSKLREAMMMTNYCPFYPKAYVCQVCFLCARTLRDTPLRQHDATLLAGAP